MAIANLSVDDLARNCADETRKFSLRQLSDPQFCFELMRRALMLGVAEAFTHVYRIYEPQVIRWVYSHRQFEYTGEDADYFASSAISNFYFALRGVKFQKFPTLSAILSYLKLCVHTAIMQYLRDQRPGGYVPLDEQNDPGDNADPAAGIHAGELWAHINELLSDDTDRLLVHLTYTLQLKPAQIVISHSSIWATERDVSVALQRVRRMLRRDAELRGWAGVGSSDPAQT